jgi:NAD+-dependent secondary alcohol dehydrogenase Adh1
MKAVRLHEYHQQPVIEDVPEPKATQPFDVVVRIGGAGVCRTDLHIIEEQWAAKSGVTLPSTIGHENAGWVEEIGSGVTNVAVGDPVILHPTPTCGLCHACRAADDMHCVASRFPGIDSDGGMAEYLLTSARAYIELDPGTQPADVAALADAGITAHHAVHKAVPLLYPGTVCVVNGAGGLGHIGIQSLAALTATTIVVVDRNPEALDLATKLGADHTIVADGTHVDAVLDLTGGNGAEVHGDYATGADIVRRALAEPALLIAGQRRPAGGRDRRQGPVDGRGRRIRRVARALREHDRHGHRRPAAGVPVGVAERRVGRRPAADDELADRGGTDAVGWQPGADDRVRPAGRGPAPALSGREHTAVPLSGSVRGMTGPTREGLTC